MARIEPRVLRLYALRSINDREIDAAHSAGRRLGGCRSWLLALRLRFPRRNGTKRVQNQACTPGRSLHSHPRGLRSGHEHVGDLPVDRGQRAIGGIRCGFASIGRRPSRASSDDEGCGRSCSGCTRARMRKRSLRGSTSTGRGRCCGFPRRTPPSRASAQSCWPLTSTAALAPRCSASTAHGWSRTRRKGSDSDLRSGS